MEVVLLENIKNLGQIGDIVKVKRGHGRNFLIKYGDLVHFLFKFNGKVFFIMRFKTTK